MTLTRERLDQIRAAPYYYAHGHEDTVVELVDEVYRLRGIIASHDGRKTKPECPGPYCACHRCQEYGDGGY
jgi:hypothetical protein